MARYIFIGLLLTSIPSFAQLYFSKKSARVHFAHIHADSARVERFSMYRYFCYKTNEEKLHPNRSGDTVFSGNNNHIIIRRKTYYLLYRYTDSKKFHKVLIEKCNDSLLESLRKEAYELKIRNKVRYLLDSLGVHAGPYTVYRYDLPHGSQNKNITFQDYKPVADKVYDSLAKEIVQNKNPKVDEYYRKMDSLSFLDSSQVYDLLAKADYNFGYASYSLRKIAKEKPEFLIRYIDKRPLNQDTVLRAIRYHRYSWEIAKNIKACPLQTKGKSLIIEQHSKQVAQGVAWGSFSIALTLAELSLIVLLVRAIVR